MSARLVAIVSGVVLVLAGLLGFFNDPMFGLFDVNAAHNLLLIAAGIVLLCGAYTGLGSRPALTIVGVAFLLWALLGFFLSGADGMVLGFIANNTAGTWLHLVLAAILLAGAACLSDEERSIPL